MTTKYKQLPFYKRYYYNTVASIRLFPSFIQELLCHYRGIPDYYQKHPIKSSWISYRSLVHYRIGNYNTTQELLQIYRNKQENSDGI